MAREIIRLGDVLTLKRGYDLANRERNDGVVPVISSSGVTGFHDVAKVRPPGVVTGRYGTLGQVHFSDVAFWPLNTALYVTDFKGNDPRYCAALLQASSLASRSGAAAVPGLNRNDLHEIPVPAISLDEQRKIAAVLGAYDDLDRNYRRRIEILNEVGLSVFKQCFGPEQRLGEEVAAARPREMLRLDELCTRIQSGGTPTRSNASYWDNKDIPWFRTTDLRDSHLLGDGEPISFEGLRSIGSRLFGPGTIVMAIYGAPTVGRLGILTTTSTFNQAALGLEAGDRINNVFLFYALHELRAYFNSIAQGAAQQNISKAKVAETEIEVPTADTLNHFTSVVRPTWDQKLALLRLRENLQEQRGLILPKLVSGEIDLTELKFDTAWITKQEALWSEVP